MASIIKLPNGKFKATVYLGRDADGKKITKSITRDTERSCRLESNQMEIDYANGKDYRVDNLKLIDWCNEWLEMNENRLSPSTYVTYQIYIDKHYKPYFKNIKLGKLTEIMITRFVNHQLKTLSGTTVRKHIYVLRKILQKAMKGNNPALYVEIPDKSQYVANLPTEKEIETVLNDCRGTKYEIMYLIHSWGGLRRSEICALRWKDIDYKGNTIKIDETTVLGKNGYIDKDETKSSNGQRDVALPDKVFNLLKPMQAGKKLDDKVFGIKPSTLTQHFQDIKGKYKLDITMHNLRHYHASWLMENGIPDQYAAERLGHDVNTLRRIYQLINNKGKVDINKKITDMLDDNNKD